MIKITRSRTLLMFALITLCYFSCRKDTENYTLSDPTVAQQLKEAYLSNAIPTHQLFSDMKPLWSKVYSAKLEEETVYEVALSNPDRIFQGGLSGGKSEEAEGRSNIRLVMTKNNDGGQYRTFYMSVISDGENTALAQVHYKNTGRFSGRILFYSIKGEFINGWSYNAGEIDQSISAGTKKSYDETRSKRVILLNTERTGADAVHGKISRLYWPGECHTETIATYGVSCISVANYTNCSLYQTGTTYLTYCSEGGGGGGGGVGNPPGGGGGSGDGAVDCHGVMNGSATPAPCGCIGGTTGITECWNVEVKTTDSLKQNYPCLDKLVFAKLNVDTAFKRLLAPFTPASTVVPILTYTYSSQVWGAAGKYSLGQTVSLLSWNSRIELNSNALSNASELFIATGIIHETAHAYVSYYIHAGSYGIPEPSQTWAMKIVDYDRMKQAHINSGYSNYFDHSQFLEEYFDQMVSVLKNYAGQRYTLQECQMATLYGLDNAGEAPTNPTELPGYNFLKNVLTTSRNNIKAKYGITDAQLNTFNLKNVVNTPSVNKLPNTCP